MASWTFAEVRDPAKTMLTYWGVTPACLARSLFFIPVSLRMKLTIPRKEKPRDVRMLKVFRLTFVSISTSMFRFQHKCDM